MNEMQDVHRQVPSAFLADPVYPWCLESLIQKRFARLRAARDATGSCGGAGCSLDSVTQRTFTWIQASSAIARPEGGWSGPLRPVCALRVLSPFFPLFL